MTFNSILFLQGDTAAVGKSGGMGDFSLVIMMLLLFVVMYFFMIRPQQKKQKKLREIRNSLTKGDKVITQGGIFGVIVEVKDDYFLVEIDNNVKVRVVKDLIYKDVSDMQRN